MGLYLQDNRADARALGYTKLWNDVFFSAGPCVSGPTYYPLNRSIKYAP